MRARWAPLLALVSFLGGCDGVDGPTPSGPGRDPTPPPGVAVEFQGIPVRADLVEPLVPYVQGYRPNEAPDSIRRWLLLRHAIPMAWALHRYGPAYERERQRALADRQRLEQGEIGIEALARRLYASYSGGAVPAGVGRPQTQARAVLWATLGRALFTAKPGDLVGPVRTPLGWSLAKVQGFRRGLVRDQDLVTFQEAQYLPGGREQAEKVNQAKPGPDNRIRVVDPAWREVVPLVMRAAAGPRPPAPREAENQKSENP